MQPLKRFFEWYLGAPPAEPGQGTQWQFGFTSPFPNWMPAWLVLVSCATAVAMTVVVYRRDAHSAPRIRRIAMVLLRVAAVAMVLLFLTGLTLTIDRTGLPVVVVMIDDSASMGLEDQYRDEDVEAAVRELLAVSDTQAPVRLNLAKGILAADDGSFLKQLVRNHKLRVYRFSETAVPVGRAEYLRAKDVDELLANLNALEPTGENTRPGPAVRKVLEDLRGTPPTAIVLLTDGITSTTDADRLSAVAGEALDKLVPLFCIGVGSEEPARDLQLYDVVVDEVAFVNDTILFSARLKGYGYRGKSVKVTLRERGADGTLDERNIQIGEDGRPQKIELTHVPPEAGEFDYVVAVESQSDETNPDNNAETRHVSVRAEKIRVLLADSTPRYEYRYLKHVLERDKTVDVATVLQEADVEYSSEDDSALPHFPVKREDLFRYDVIVLGDVNPGFLSSGVQQNLQEFVSEAGGGVVFVAGPQYDPIAYRGSPLEVMLPIDLAGAKLPRVDGTIVDGFRPQLTMEGMKGSSIFRFADGEQESRRIWNDLPDLYWLLEAPSLKDGAVVFAEHPRRMGAKGRLPVIAMQRYGGGKVVFHATPELWRWRFRAGDQYYGRYWVQLIRYLSRSKLLGGDRTAELTADRLVYQRGGTVQLRVRFFDERLIPAGDEGVIAMIERRGDVQRPVALTRAPQSPAVFTGQFPRAPEGSYHAWIATPAFNEAPPSTDFRVEAPLQELEKRSLDRADLTLAADTTHGRYYPLDEAASVPDDVPRGHAVPLESQDPILIWNRWELLTLFAVLLMCEWLLRKRTRLV